VRWSEGGLECIHCRCVCIIMALYVQICAVLVVGLFAEVSCFIRPRDALACAKDLYACDGYITVFVNSPINPRLKSN
jgi:hypothetical protein